MVSALALVFLAIRYPKVSIPTVIVASATIPTFVYASQEKNDCFGISYGTEMTIHVPKIDYNEIKEYEMKANEAREEMKKRKQNGL